MLSIANVLSALGVVYVHLSEQRQITKRALFYRQVDIARKQAVIDRGGTLPTTATTPQAMAQFPHRPLLIPFPPTPWMSSAIDTLCSMLQVQRGHLQVVSHEMLPRCRICSYIPSLLLVPQFHWFVLLSPCRLRARRLWCVGS